MTTPVASNSPSLHRSNSAPVLGASEKPALTRTNSAPHLTTPYKSNPAATRPQSIHTQDSLEPAAKTSAAAARQNLLGKYVQNATDAAHANGAAGAFGKLKTGGGIAASVAGIGANAAGLASAIKNGDSSQAVDNGILLGKSVLNTVKGGLDAAAMIQSGKEFKNLKDAAQAALGANGQVGKNIAGKVAESVLSGKPLRDVDVLGELAKSKGAGANIGTTLKQGAADVLRGLGGEKLAGKLEGGISKAGQQIASGGAHGLTDAAKNGLKTGDAIVDAAKGAEAAAKLGAKGAGTAAKAAGRFAPGLNIGIAALDTALAAKTIADPKASVASKVTSGITAAGSIVAATNIPIVSQVGAAVSTASSVAGAVVENFGAIKEGAKKAAEGVKNFFSGW
ncbi:hypothetical protein ATI61_102664 [Archangium gephyra]|uniref:Uncharacterized protein n=1 Tax=Archangium gephyra TaxID=48 RepID=A0AAC8QDM9_9BACT|nr:hypothetical protein [Archangium gephyra]AKJ05606.1 Hypothetical protein AA314_07232 [Archangium gephyra]REG36287.1 hypothetical protein ATI61_102664 [Archangium gephyra]